MRFSEATLAERFPDNPKARDHFVEQASIKIVRKLGMHPSVILSGVVVLGMLEFVALQRSQRAMKRD